MQEMLKLVYLCFRHHKKLMLCSFSFIVLCMFLIKAYLIIHNKRHLMHTIISDIRFI